VVAAEELQPHRNVCFSPFHRGLSDEKSLPSSLRTGDLRHQRFKFCNCGLCSKSSFGSFVAARELGASSTLHSGANAGLSQVDNSDRSSAYVLRSTLNPPVPKPRTQCCIELPRAPASKGASAGKWGIGRIGTALEIDAQYVIFPDDYLTIGLSNRLHFLIPSVRS
jgi:hypothetical protein